MMNFDDTCICRIAFYQKAVSVENILSFITELVDFRVTSYDSDVIKGKLSKDRFFEFLTRSINSMDAFRFSASNGKLERKVTVWGNPADDIIQIYIKFPYLDNCVLTKTEDILRDFIEKNKILYAIIRTMSDWSWNNSTDIEIQKENHPEIKELKTAGHYPLIEVDTKQFPASSLEYEGMWFGCCYEMWFGSDYGKFISLDKIKSISDCKLNEVMNNGTVHIVLYDSPTDYSSEVSVRRAWAFRKITDCDTAADAWVKRVDTLRNEKGLFTIDMIDGLTPHGGIKTIKTYLDAKNKIEFKCKAVKVHVSERDAFGKEIYGETIKLK